MAYEFRYTRKFNFYETDMAGIAHFSNFFRWMEEAECAFFESLGANFVQPLKDNTAFRGWPRVRTHCEYHAPVRFGDELIVHLLVKELKVRAIEYVFYFYAGKSGSEPAHVATGGMTTVCIEGDLAFGAKLEARAIPDELLKQLEAAPAESLRRRHPSSRLP